MTDKEFQITLAKGHEKEDALVATLNSLNYVRTYTSQSLGKVSGWDISTSQCDACPDFTIETKYDMMAAKTGNVAVEIESRDNSGKIIPSGLSATTADIWAFAFSDLPHFYYLPVSELNQFLSEKNYHKIIWGGYKHLSHIMLIKRDVFLTHCSTYENANIA